MALVSAAKVKAPPGKLRKPPEAPPIWLSWIMAVWPQTGSRQLNVVATMGSPGVGAVRGPLAGAGEVTMGEGDPRAWGPIEPLHEAVVINPARRAAARKIRFSAYMR